MSWRLILEELSPEVIYINGFIYMVEDALSRLNKLDYVNNTSSNNNDKFEPALESLSENFA